MQIHPRHRAILVPHCQKILQGSLFPWPCVFVPKMEMRNGPSWSGCSNAPLPQQSSLLPLHHDKGMFPVFFEAYGDKLDWAGLDDPGIVKKCAVREYPKSVIDKYQAAW